MSDLFGNHIVGFSTRWLKCLCISDYVVVGSDSGRIVILEYLAQKNIFDKVGLLAT